MAKAHYIGVDGVARKGKQPFIGVDGVSRKCKSGHIGVNGVARQFMSGGVLASSLAVGSSVYLMEGGSPVEYLVVNQGKPQRSSLYDSSCDGTWLLRKDCYIERIWTNSKSNNYSNSGIHSYLNSTFYNLFDSTAKSAIKQVKIPYRPGDGVGTTVFSGANGLPTKVFLLSFLEVGYAAYLACQDGVKLDYFTSSHSSRIAYLSGRKVAWWLRSPHCNPDYTSNDTWYPKCVNPGGDSNYGISRSDSHGIRPAIVIHSNALFDPETMILKSAS